MTWQKNACIVVIDFEETAYSADDSITSLQGLHLHSMRRLAYV